MKVSKNDTSYVIFDRNLTDFVKFLSCVLIALHHYSQYVLSRGISQNKIYEIVYLQGGYFGVALFFFLSGYGLMKSEQKNHLSFLPFFRKRYLRVYLPVILSAIIWIPIKIFVLNESFSVSHLVDLFWGWCDPILWFVKCLLLLYACFYIYVWIRSKYADTWKRILTISVLMFGTFVLQYKIAVFSCISVPLFFWGIVVGDFVKIKEYFSRLWVSGFVVAFILIICFLCYFYCHNMIFINVAFNYVFVVLWITISSVWTIPMLPMPKWMGNLSYDVYLTHNKCLIFLDFYMPVIPLWVFVMSATIMSFVFYKLRTFLKM